MLLSSFRYDPNLNDDSVGVGKERLTIASPLTLACSLVKKGAILLSGNSVWIKSRKGLEEAGGRGTNREMRPIASFWNRDGTPGRIQTVG